MPVSLGAATITAMYLGTTAIPSAYLGTTQVFSSATFSPSSLFALAEPGVWYDPSDLTTLFTDTAGTTPVTTPAQTVALMLDKSKGLALGAELANQNLTTYANYGPLAFDTFTATATSLTLANATSKTTIASSPDTISVVSGKSYTISYAANVVSGGFTATIRNAAAGTSYASGPQITTSGTFSFVFTASVTENVVFQITATAGVANYTFSNISVRELAGNHATQATAASRPTFGVVPLGGRRNILLQTEAFSDAAWTKLNATVTANSTVAPDGTTTADTLTDNATSGAHYAQVLNIFTADGAIRFWSIYVKQGTARYISLSSYDLDITTSVSSRVTFDMQTGVYTVQGNEADTVLTPVNAGNGWWRIGFSSNTNSARYDGFRVEMNSGGTSVGASYSGTGSTAFIWGAQLELGSTATAYQKVTNAFDVTEAGVQSLSYLSFDGVDDGMVTGTITPGVDKAQVFAGVRKLSDAARGVVAELSAIVTNPGAFVVYAPSGTATPAYLFGSGGTSTGTATSPSSYAAPITNVLTGIGDIAGDNATLRINGTQVAQSTADQGTGNFLAYPLYLGRRAGTTLPFNGNIFSLLVRFGANLTTPQITDTETWVAGKTGVTL